MPIIDVDGTSLHYEEQGDRNRPTVVLVHPILFGSHVFDALAAELASDFHVVRPDVHGHGRSGYRAPLTIDGITADFHALMESLHLERVTWVGYSIGGMVGMRLAVRHPEAIGALALVATTASAEPPHLREAAGKLWQLFAAGHREDIVDAALQFFFSPATYREHPELIARYRRDVVERGDVDGIVAAAHAAMERTDIMATIRAIAVPTLVVAGRDDIGAAGPAEAQAIAAAIPGARLAIVEDANHLLALEKSAEFVRLVSTFVRSSSRDRGGSARAQTVPA